MKAFADKLGVPIVADILRSDDINRFEEEGKTVVEGDPTLPVSGKFMDLARLLLSDPEKDSGERSGFYH